MPTDDPGSIVLLDYQPKPWWNSSVFYEIFVRSFADSDGEGIGDFNGLTAKLPYLNDGDPNTSTDLGVTAIWLMPIQPSPSYHGYDVTDYAAVNPQYGTLEDFKRLLTEAHRLGIRVIIDLVLNHSSAQHPWFVAAQDPASPYHDYYLWSDQDPAWKGPDGQTVWHKAQNGLYYYGLFSAGMPDLNYTNPAVTKAMQDAAIFWLKDVGVDGFRLDAARHLIEDGRNQANTLATHAWWKQFRGVVTTARPDALTVGEIWDKTPLVAEYTRGDELNLAFDFDLASAWVIAAASKDARPARTVLKRDLAQFERGQFATFLTNHDQNRVMTQVNEDPDKAKIAAALLLTAPGVPFLYYGEEIGMTGQKPDEQIRTPMQWDATRGAGFTTGTPWQPISARAAQANVAAQQDDPQSLLATYRSLIHLRAQYPALADGDAWPVESDNGGVYALLRATPDQAVLVIINMGSEPVDGYRLSLASGPLRGSFRQMRALGAAVGYPPLTANAAGGFDAYGQGIPLAPYQILLLELRS